MNKPTVSCVSPGSYSPPLGRPVPNASDVAEAERIYDETTVEFGMIHNRADYVERFARMVQQKRLEAEHRAQFHPKMEKVACGR